MKQSPVKHQPHWTRGRVATVAVLILAAITVAVWGWAGADTVAPVSISGFPGGTARVLAGVSYDFNTSFRPENMSGTYDTYFVQTFAGSLNDLQAVDVDFHPTTSGRNLCSQWARLSAHASDFLVDNQILGGPEPVSLQQSFTFRSSGLNYVFAFMIGYNQDSGFDPNNLSDQTCNLGDIAASGYATSFNVEANSWGCNKGICIINVDPQVLPSGSNSTSYMVYVSGMQSGSTYGFVTGRYEQDLPAGGSSADICTTVISHPTGSGAAQVGSLVTLNPATEGSAYLSSRYNLTFNNGAANRRIVAILLKKDGANQDLGHGTAVCSSAVGIAGWSYASNGAGTGTSTGDTPDPTPSTVSHSGGFIATGLTIEDTTASSGSFLSGVCSSGSNIRLNLPGNSASNSSGIIDLQSAGLMGICTPNVGGQILKLLMILAAFFFTVTTITSGIAMMRASDSAALENAKKNLISSAIGAAIIVFANWIVPVAIDLIAKLFR